VEEMIVAYSEIGKSAITRKLLSEDLLSWLRFKDGALKI